MTTDGATRFSHLLTRLLASRLDARLAAGAGPETGRLLGARAMHLTGRSNRRRLADAWDDVTARAATPCHPADPRLPVARASVRAAAAEIAGVAALLRGPATLDAGDVARFRLLLTDGAGPVYVDDGALGPTLRRLLLRVGTAGSARVIEAPHRRGGGNAFGRLIDGPAPLGHIEYARRPLS